MQYLGGKSKIRFQLANLISERLNGRNYFEPFTGGGWVLQEVVAKKRFASDYNKALIAMYQELQRWWMPPDFISEEEYQKLKEKQDHEDPLTAFVGFGCSFAGKWFGGYARSKGKDCYASTTKRSLLKQLPKILDVKFNSASYDTYSPKGVLVYCDPPYANTTGYTGTGRFDNNRFWDVMREWSKDNTVLISEYSAPEDFQCVLEVGSQMGMTKNGERPVANEKVFTFKI